MFINQLSVFIENREGRLEQVLEALKNNNINIVSLSLADTSEYGMLRMIVSDHEKGQLQILLAKICEAGINIDYMYALATGSDDASIVIKTADLKKASEILEETGIELISSGELKG